jgi:hypothetical protein
MTAKRIIFITLLIQISTLNLKAQEFEKVNSSYINSLYNFISMDKYKALNQHFENESFFYPFTKLNQDILIVGKFKKDQNEKKLIEMVIAKYIDDSVFLSERIDCLNKQSTLLVEDGDFALPKDYIAFYKKIK